MAVAAALGPGGCSSDLATMGTARATQGYITAIHDDLVALPPPRDRLVVAVYKFRDQTGQYKTSSLATTFSTAVTQGATSMLIEALEDSGWFVVIEREALTNLLNERKIIRSARAEYASQPGVQAPALPPLPPMLYAGILLEGGIIGYDTNLLVGGAGVRYYGVGGSGEVRKDQVTIYLRVVSVQNGRVLESVSTSKSILSREVDFGIYRFVRVKRLLEVEIGFSTNEPPTMAVQEAIEKAVYDLIVQGILDGVWQLKNPEDMNSPAIQNYLAERRQQEKIAFDKCGNLVKVESDPGPSPGAAPKKTDNLTPTKTEGPTPGKTEGPTPGKTDGTSPVEVRPDAPRRAGVESKKQVRWTPPRFPWTYVQDLPCF
jgi:curli production assembly/transport component CsgG